MRGHGHFECYHFGPIRHCDGHHGPHGPFGHHGHGHHGHHGHKHGHGKFGHGKFGRHGHHHGPPHFGHPGFGPHFGMFGPWAVDRRGLGEGPCRRGPMESRCGREDGPGRHGSEDGPFRRGFGHFHGRGPWERPGNGCGRDEGRKAKECCCRKDGKKDQGTQAFVIERVIVDNDPRCNSV